MNKFWIVSPALFALACVPVDKGDDSGDSGEDVEDTDTDVVDDDPSPSADWGADAVTITVDGGPGGYWLGMAETADSSDPWTGEDCVWGYELSSGEVIGPYCHDLGDGGSTVLTYGGSTSDLQAGTTVFTSETGGDRVTYFLESDPDFGGSGDCWTWGNDPSYYAGLGCSEL